MDEQLAAIYGTGDQAVSDNDLEKVAAAELLVKLAEDQGIDLSDFSDEDVMDMVGELSKSAEEHSEEHSEEAKKGLAQFAKEEAKEKESEGDDEKKEEKQEEKIAEADFLGRVMAHSFTQEMDSIQKTAGKIKVVKKGADTVVNKVKNYFTGAAGQVSKGAKNVVGRGNKKVNLNRLEDSDIKQMRREQIVAGLKGMGIGAGKLALPVAGVGAAGLGLHHALKSKEGSALDTLAEARAVQMLQEAGYAQEKTASAVEVAVERRALEMLEANGYPVEWNQ
jgi:hypothetical protein